jgi:hypothetical protein
VQEPPRTDLEGQRGTRAGSRSSKINKIGTAGEPGGQAEPPGGGGRVNPHLESEPSTGYGYLAEGRRRGQPRRSDLAISRTE